MPKKFNSGKAFVELPNLVKALQGLVDNACAACEVLPKGIYRVDATKGEWNRHVKATAFAKSILEKIAKQFLTFRFDYDIVSSIKEDKGNKGNKSTKGENE